MEYDPPKTVEQESDTQSTRSGDAKETSSSALDPESASEDRRPTETTDDHDSDSEWIIGSPYNSDPEDTMNILPQLRPGSRRVIKAADAADHRKEEVTQVLSNHIDHKASHPHPLIETSVNS